MSNAQSPVDAPSPGKRPPRKVGLAFKLAIFILSGTICIFAASFFYYYYFTKQIILKNASEQAKNLTESTLYEIETALRGAEQVPLFLAYVFESDPPKQQRLERYLRDFLLSSPTAFGGAAAFEPYAFDPRKKYFATYFYKQKGELHNVQLGCEEYDYFVQDWYLIPKELDRPMWSEPYYDEGGGDIVMSTYSVPFDRMLAGEVVFGGIVTVDVSLDWLHDLVSSIRIYNTGSAFLISRNGVFVSAPNKKNIMRESIFSIAEELNDPGIRALGKDMTAGRHDFVKVPEALFGKPYWLYYAPMPATGWALGVAIPDDELFADLHNLSRKVLYISLIGFALLFMVIVGISMTITRPIKILASKTSEIARGNLDVDLPTQVSNDEVGDLAHSFDGMRVALKEYISNLTETTKAKERMESELKIARNIQMSFLPKRFPPFPAIASFSLHAALEPAWEVGGDLYDFFLLDDNHLFFSVGDVSGKGAPAALFMAVTKTLVKGIAEQDMDPAAILRSVNTELCLDNESMLFVTMFCGILDFTSGELAFSNAGHNPPLLVPAQGEPSWLKLPQGFFLGIMPDGAYETFSTPLAPGDKLVVFTDGVTEAMDEQEKFFTDAKLLDVVARNRDKTADALTAIVMDAVHSFAGTAPQADDITVLILEYHG